MNERIKELAKQAGAQGIVNRDFIDVEKFAELIVREFCQKLEDDGMVEIAIEMKQHFGVEE